MIVARCQLDKVAKAATRACFERRQLCISIERIYARKGHAEEFTRSSAMVRNMKLGTAYDFSVDISSLIPKHAEKPCPVTDDAIVKGAMIAGGKARPDIGPVLRADRADQRRT